MARPASPSTGSSRGQNTRPTGIGDINGDGFADIRVGAETDDPNGLTDDGQAYIVYGKPSPPATKFYVVNDASSDRTYEYTATGASERGLRPEQRQHRPARRRQHGRRGQGLGRGRQQEGLRLQHRRRLLGSWTAGSLASNATVEGIATNGTDIWIVDAQQDKVFRYTGAASRLSGSQNAASSFNLNSSNTSPKDIVTDGTNLWVVNDSSTDKVFKYTLSGSLLGSWTISGAGTSPTGITLDPSNVGNLWIVDSGTKRVYQFDNAAGRTSGSQSPSTSFALAAGNTNPQGIADPPVGLGLPVANTARDRGTRFTSAIPHEFVASLPLSDGRNAGSGPPARLRPRGRSVGAARSCHPCAAHRPAGRRAVQAPPARAAVPCVPGAGMRTRRVRRACDDAPCRGGACRRKVS